jgi:hypothetical protein
MHQGSEYTDIITISPCTPLGTVSFRLRFLIFALFSIQCAMYFLLKTPLSI